MDPLSADIEAQNNEANKDAEQGIGNQQQSKQQNTFLVCTTPTAIIFIIGLAIVLAVSLGVSFGFAGQNGRASIDAAGRNQRAFFDLAAQNQRVFIE